MRKKMKKTASESLKEAPALAKKGTMTFSAVDGSNIGIGQKKAAHTPTLTPQQWDELIEVLKTRPEPKVTVHDLAPQTLNVEAPNVKVEAPKVDVQVNPTPVKVSVPTALPEVYVNNTNNMQIKPLVWAAFLMVILLGMDFGLKLWLSQM